MSISADLLSILACPSADHAPLRLETSAAGEHLVCTSCLSRFPISDGIPVLLADEAVPGPRGLGVPADEASADEASADEASADEASATEASATDEAPVGEAPAAQPPAGSAAPGQQPGDSG
ncbi:MAG TPA: Trm112 family protein [Jatrophihabitans sp.]|nr:Trm112 family protein [Jatrophihabitans sp.]